MRVSNKVYNKQIYIYIYMLLKVKIIHTVVEDPLSAISCVFLTLSNKHKSVKEVFGRNVCYVLGGAAW